MSSDERTIIEDYTLCEPGGRGGICPRNRPYPLLYSRLGPRVRVYLGSAELLDGLAHPHGLVGLPMSCETLEDLLAML